MTTPTSEDPYPPQYPVIQEEAPPPFPDATKFELTKPVNQEQLTDEINKATGSSVTLAIMGPDDFNAAISETNQATLFVNRKVDSKVVEKVIEEHDPDDAYAVPEAELAFQTVLQKVIEDPTSALSDDELRAAVHGLLIRYANQSVAPPRP